MMEPMDTILYQLQSDDGLKLNYDRKDEAFEIAKAYSVCNPNTTYMVSTITLKTNLLFQNGQDFDPDDFIEREQKGSKESNRKSTKRRKN